MKLVLDLDGERFEVEVRRDGGRTLVACEDGRLEAHVAGTGQTLEVVAGNRRWTVDVQSDTHAIVNGRRISYGLARFEPGEPALGPGAQSRVAVTAVMHGRLVKVLVEPGREVAKGDPLFVLEAMKMQNELASPTAGRLAEIVAKPGDVVDVGRVLAWLERRKE